MGALRHRIASAIKQKRHVFQQGLTSLILGEIHVVHLITKSCSYRYNTVTFLGRTLAGSGWKVYSLTLQHEDGKPSVRKAIWSYFPC